MLSSQHVKNNVETETEPVPVKHLLMQGMRREGEDG